MGANHSSVHISFQDTIMTVNRLRLQGRVIFNITFADGRPAESLTRKKDFAGYYWVSLLRPTCQMATLMGNRIIEHMSGSG